MVPRLSSALRGIASRADAKESRLIGTGNGGLEALTLRRRYRLGVAAVLLPLLLLIAGLAFVQYRSERAALLERLGRDSAELATDVDALVKIAGDHVRQLRQAAEDAMQGRLPTPVSPLRALLPGKSWSPTAPQATACS